MSYGFFDKLGFVAPGDDVHRAETRRIVEALADAATVGESRLRQHVLTVAGVSYVVAVRIGLDDDDIETLMCGALLHDLGKLGVPENILMKDGPLTADEWRIVREHPGIGAAMIQPLEVLSGAVGIVRHHHERFDGKGYPDGLSGEDIPLPARIVTVADAVSAMVLTRPYRTSLPEHRVEEELRNNSGGQFDPVLATAMLEALPRLDELDIPGRFA